MPRRLLIRGAQPLIPCTPLSRSRRYKSPCRAIFCLSYPANVPAETSTALTRDIYLSCEPTCRDDQLSYPANVPAEIISPASSLHLETIISLLYYNSRGDNSSSPLFDDFSSSLLDPAETALLSLIYQLLYKPREPTCYYRFLRRFDTSQHLSG